MHSSLCDCSVLVTFLQFLFFRSLSLSDQSTVYLDTSAINFQKKKKSLWCNIRCITFLATELNMDMNFLYNRTSKRRTHSNQYVIDLANRLYVDDTLTLSKWAREVLPDELHALNFSQVCQWKFANFVIQTWSRNVKKLTVTCQWPWECFCERIQTQFGIRLKDLFMSSSIFIIKYQ